MAEASAQNRVQQVDEVSFYEQQRNTQSGCVRVPRRQTTRVVKCAPSPQTPPQKAKRAQNIHEALEAAHGGCGRAG